MTAACDYIETILKINIRAVDCKIVLNVINVNRSYINFKK